MMQHNIVSNAERKMVNLSTYSLLVSMVSILFTKTKGVSKPRSSSFIDYLWTMTSSPSIVYLVASP
jgi:hypothetical protein